MKIKSPYNEFIESYESVLKRCVEFKEKRTFTV